MESTQDSLSTPPQDFTPRFERLKQEAKARREAQQANANVLAPHLPLIEDALAHGVRHRHVLAMFNEAGFSISEPTYYFLLARARKAAKARAEQAST